MTKTYNSDSIKVLSALQHMRLRKGVYIGECNDPRQLLSEVFDNAIDEVQAGYSKELVVNIDTKNNIYSVRDYGRGIPHGMKTLDNGEQKETLEVLLTVSNSGGKFTNDAYMHSCFTGDTLVRLTDGRDVSFEQLSKEFSEGRTNYCYTVSETGLISIEKIVFCGVTRQTDTLVNVTLDSGETIQCTEDHKFMTRDGLFVEAKDLTSGMSLMPGRFGHTTDCFSEYDAIWDNQLNKNVLCHYLADDYNVRHDKYTAEQLIKTNRHHKDVNRTNNNPDNIERLTRSEHTKIHVDKYFEELKNDEEAWKDFCKTRSRIATDRINNMTEEEKQEWLNKSILSEEARVKAAIAGSETLTKYNRSEKGRETSRRNGKTIGKKNFLDYVTSEKGRAQHSAIMTHLNENNQQELALKGRVLQVVSALLSAGVDINKESYNTNKLWMAVSWDKAIELFGSVETLLACAVNYTNKLTLEEIHIENNKHAQDTRDNNDLIQYLAKRGAILKSVKAVLEAGKELTADTYKQFKLRHAVCWDKALNYFDSTEDMITCANNYNHKVLKIETIHLNKKIDVYDLTVSGNNHTFLLTAGVFVHNCGLNGMGLTVTNALSKYMEVTSYRDGRYVNAITQPDDTVQINYGISDEHNGTLVMFSPDKQHFHSAKIPPEFIKDRCRVASALGFRARLIIDGVEQKTDASMFDLIKEENDKLSTYVNVQPIEVIATSAEKMKVALRYTSDTNDRYFGYTNLLSNYLGGTHVQELAKTVTACWIEFLDKHKNIKPAVDLHNSDYLVGLRGVCAVFIAHPEFSSQTKEKLVVNKKYFEELMSLFKARFLKYLEDNIVIAQQLIKRFEEYRIAQNNLLSRKEISSLIKINNDSEDNIRRRSVVSKLVECTSRRRKDTELFIVEGNSAMGPFLFTRDIEKQAVLPLRGKILNITNKTVKEAVKNSEICDIANAMGCGIGANCDANKSRYDKICIAADADPDGEQINCLILSVFINLFPDMVKQGRVYLTLPPLYCWGDNPKNYGWCNKVEDIPKNLKGTITRFKGLGEMQNEQLKYFLVDPQTRNTLQIQYPSDIDEFNRILGSTEGKRDLLTELGIIERGDN